jgi:hypothetical protein
VLSAEYAVIMLEEKVSKLRRTSYLHFGFMITGQSVLYVLHQERVLASLDLKAGESIIRWVAIISAFVGMSLYLVFIKQFYYVNKEFI